MLDIIFRYIINYIWRKRDEETDISKEKRKR